VGWRDISEEEETMKKVMMYLIREGKMTKVHVEDVPQMDNDEDMIQYAKDTELFGKYLRLFERPVHFEVEEE